MHGYIYRLSEVIEEDPDNGNATFCRGLVHYDLKDYPTTIELFQLTLNITANHSGALYNLGVLYTGKILIAIILALCWRYTLK